MSDDDRFGAPGSEGWDELEEADLWDEESRVGPRRAALEKRKKKRRRKRTAFGTFLIVAGTAVAVAVVLYAAREVTRDDPGPPATDAVAPDTATTVLLFGTTESSAGEERAIWATLLVHDPEEIKGAVAYIPAHTAVEVPGRGLLALGEAYESGGIPLLLVTAENLFGVTIDRYLQLSDNDARVLFSNIGQLTVDVPHEVRVRAGQGNTRVIFNAGPQQLPPAFLVRLLYVVGEDGNDVSLGSRHLAFWDAVFERFGSDPQGLIDAVEAAAGSLGKSDAKPERLAALFGDLAAVPGSARTLRTLPVSPLEVPGNRLYVADEAEIEAFIEDVVGQEAALSDQIRVQILNGNGAPGIGQQVAERLVGQGFRVILSGNAKRLDYETTLIITYDTTTEGRALAERARELLGVGEVRISRQEQGIVDLTIVVGKDFLRSQ